MNPRKLDHETWRDFQVHASIIEYFTPGGVEDTKNNL